MGEHEKESSSAGETLIDKIVEKLHGHDSSDDEKSEGLSAVKAKIWRFFGRETPIHSVFGGGKGKAPPMDRFSLAEESLNFFMMFLPALSTTFVSALPPCT